MTSGATLRVKEIFLAPEAGVTPQAVEQARAMPGYGLEGDRYSKGVGTFSRWPGAQREVTLISLETLLAIEQEFGFDLFQGEHRRNIVTQGQRIEELLGKKFRIGEAKALGERKCLPCRHVERMTEGGVYEAMKKYGGGLRATILEEGIIRPGDAIIEENP